MNKFIFRVFVFIGLLNISINAFAMSTPKKVVGDWFNDCGGEMSPRSSVAYAVPVFGFDRCRQKGVKKIWLDFSINSIATREYVNGAWRPRASYPTAASVIAGVENLLKEGKVPHGYYVGEITTYYSLSRTIYSSSDLYQGYSLNTWAAELVNLHRKYGLPKPPISFAPFTFGGRSPSEDAAAFDYAISQLSSDVTHVVWQASNGGPKYSGESLSSMAGSVNSILRHYGKASLVQWEINHNNLFSVPWVDCDVYNRLAAIGFDQINAFSYYQFPSVNEEIALCEQKIPKLTISGVRYINQPVASMPDASGRDLFDGQYGQLNNFSSSAWVGFQGDAHFVVDLGVVRDIDLIRVHMGRKLSSSIDFTWQMEIATSNDGINFSSAQIINPPWPVNYDSFGPGTYDARTDADYRISTPNDFNRQARYVKILIYRRLPSQFLYLSEVEVFGH